MAKNYLDFEKEKKQEARQIEYIEFTKNCGDCGRRFKEKFAIFPDLKQYLKLVKFYWEKNSVCCPKCSQKHYEEEMKIKVKKGSKK